MRSERTRPAPPGDVVCREAAMRTLRAKMARLEAIEPGPGLVVRVLCCASPVVILWEHFLVGPWSLTISSQWVFQFRSYEEGPRRIMPLGPSPSLAERGTLCGPTCEVLFAKGI